MFTVKNFEFFPIIFADGTRKESPFVDSFMLLTKQKLTPKSLVAVIRVQKRIAEVETEAFEARKRIFEAHANEEGVIPDDKAEAFSKEIQELMAIETQVEFAELDLETESGIEMTPEEILPIERLFTFSK